MIGMEAGTLPREPATARTAVPSGTLSVVARVVVATGLAFDVKLVEASRSTGYASPAVRWLRAHTVDVSRATRVGRPGTLSRFKNVPAG
jgi:hypothetical protein